MLLTILTPEKTVLNKEPVSEVLVPGKMGQLGILPGHAPLISILGKGALKYQSKESKSFSTIELQGGYCEVQTDEVIILAEHARTPRPADN